MRNPYARHALLQKKTRIHPVSRELAGLSSSDHDSNPPPDWLKAIIPFFDLQSSDTFDIGTTPERSTTRRTR